jgi:hypothetical protein
MNGPSNRQLDELGVSLAFVGPLARGGEERASPGRGGAQAFLKDVLQIKENL